MAAALNEKEKNKLPPTAAENIDNVQPGYLGKTPQPGKLPAKATRMWVDRSEQLLEAVEILRRATVVAVDAEFAQVRSHIQGDTQTSSHRLALLQLAVEQHCFVVDALRLSDLSPLTAVVAASDIIVLLHGAGADMRVMAERGLYVVHYYDLEAASRSILGSTNCPWPLCCNALSMCGLTRAYNGQIGIGGLCHPRWWPTRRVTRR